MRSSMLTAFARAHVVFIQGNLLLARSIQLIRDGPPGLPRSVSTAIHQARKLEIPRATDSSYGKWRASKTRRYVLSVRQQKLTDNTFPKSSGRPH
jgi:hypothetical protein